MTMDLSLVDLYRLYNIKHSPDSLFGAEQPDSSDTSSSTPNSLSLSPRRVCLVCGEPAWNR